LLWKPLPEKIAANRTGGSDALFFGLSSPHTAVDSSHGSAIETPTPRRKVRREYGWWSFVEDINSFLS
jgi:hypothetical protein